MNDEHGMIMGFIDTLEKEIEFGIDTKGYFVTCEFVDRSILPITLSFDPHDVDAFEKVHERAVDVDNVGGCTVYTKEQWLDRVLEENPRIPTVLDTIKTILERISQGNSEALEYYALADMLIASNRKIDFIVDNELRQSAVAN
jgi:hypothetical protein